MQIKDAKISNLQLMFLIVGFLQGSGLLISFIDHTTKHDTWLVIVSAFLTSIPFVLSYLALANAFPGCNLVEISDIIYGPYLGKLVSVLYIGFFLLSLSLNMRDMADFYIGFLMPETPMLFFLIVFALVCAYAVRHGLETIANISFVLLTISFFIIAVTFILLLPNMDFTNFLPIFELPLKAYIQGIHIMDVVSFCEVLVFLMIIPSLYHYKDMKKYSLMGLLISAIFLLIVAVRNTAVLGILSSILISSSYQAARLIDIANVLTKMDLLIAVGITLSLFLKSSIYYYATVLSISQLTCLRSYLPMIIPVGSIAVCLSIILFESNVDHAFHATYYHPVFATPFLLIIPPFSLLIAKMRGFPKKIGGV